MEKVSSGGAFPAGGDDREPADAAQDKASAGTSGASGTRSAQSVAGLTARGEGEPGQRRKIAFRPRRADPQTAMTDDDVRHAVALLEDAERADVNLHVRDVAYAQGFERPTAVRRGVEAARRALPRVRTRRDRLDEIAHFRARRERSRTADRLHAETMANWFAELDDAQRERVEAAPSRQGGPQWMQPMKLRVPGQRALEFDAAHLQDLSASGLEALPAHARARLETSRATWRALGVESGAEAAALIDDHFERVGFQADGPLPPELARLVELHPRMAQTLQAVAREGAELHFVRCKRTPDAVLDAIRYIAENSQHNFVSTWLEQLVAFEGAPKVTDDDFEAMRSGMLEQGQRALRKVDERSFRGKVAALQFDQAREEAPDFDSRIALIEAFSPAVLCVTAAGREQGTTADANHELEALNAALHDHFGREYALRRMVFDDANRTSEGAQTIIKSLAVMAPLVEVVQDALHLGPIAKALAAAGDDALGESAELSALRGAGMTNEELRARLAVIGPAGAIALAMAGSIDEVVQELGDRAGGALFSASAVFLSFVTGVLSIRYFASHYRKLESEGKLPPAQVLDAESRAQLDRLGNIKLSKRDMLKIVDTALARSGASVLERDAVRTRLARFSSRKLLRRMRREGPLLPARKATAAGMKEAVGVNPARLGLMFGTLTSPLMGFALGPEFLHQPVLYAIAGSYETIVGALSIWAYGRSFDSRWRRFVRRREALDLSEPREPQDGAAP